MQHATRQRMTSLSHSTHHLRDYTSGLTVCDDWRDQVRGKPCAAARASSSQILPSSQTSETMPSSSSEDEMINGLRLAMSGAEMIAAISDRIERHRATIQQKREEIERGQKSADGTHCPLCEGSLEEDIASYEHRIETLMLIR